jgi:hypothetical protein
LNSGNMYQPPVAASARMELRRLSTRHGTIIYDDK